jgi:pyrimidine deaminase RibD-like protein/NTP pyrophosphatase (non-canonical NTP hydrolase)
MPQTNGPQDYEFMKLAVEQAKKCGREPGRTTVTPKVGAVVVKDGNLIGSGFRGELDPGDHAEYTVLERKLEHETLAGCTVYTTLEPCTSRNHPKIPCANRLIERKVSRVVIGMLDPNSEIRGRGQLRLREAGIATDFFATDLMSELEELNREFIRSQRTPVSSPISSPDQIAQLQNQDLDAWYKVINTIYWNQNFYKDKNALFTHLSEAIGAISVLASDKRKPGLRREKFIPKALAWWFALCGKAGVKSVSDMVWKKFPYACAYCHKNPHENGICIERKRASSGPEWDTLRILADGNNSAKPQTLAQWQRMFAQVYPTFQGEGYGPTFARLMEELGELAEAVRVFPEAPGYFLSEAADVFAWLMHVQNLIEDKSEMPIQNRGQSLAKEFSLSYPGGCTECGGAVCSCPPILASTIGRIGHEVPPGRGSFEKDGGFMTIDRARDTLKRE